MIQNAGGPPPVLGSEWTDDRTLCELYVATGGDEWDQNAGWGDPSLPICSFTMHGFIAIPNWVGVYCDPNDNVIQL